MENNYKKVGHMLSKEGEPKLDERGLSSGMRSILSKQAGTSVFQKYASPLESYSSPAPVAVDNASAFTSAFEAAKTDKKANSNTEDSKKEEKEEKEEENKDEEKTDKKKGPEMLGDIDPNMQDDVNVSSSSVVQEQDGNPGDVTVEDNTLMKVEPYYNTNTPKTSKEEKNRIKDLPAYKYLKGKGKNILKKDQNGDGVTNTEDWKISRDKAIKNNK